LECRSDAWDVDQSAPKCLAVADVPTAVNNRDQQDHFHPEVRHRDHPDMQANPESVADREVPDLDSQVDASAVAVPAILDPGTHLTP
jgi:hypothetical protein